MMVLRWVFILSLCQGLLFFTPMVQAEETGFHHESGAGVVITSGNTKTQSWNAKSVSTYEFSGNLFKFPAYFLRATSQGLESAKRWGLGLRYERSLSDRLWVFVGESLDADVYAGYTQRYATDVGPKYKVIEEPTLKWNGELGYRYLNEHRTSGPTPVNSQFLRLYTEAEKKWSESYSNALWLEYLPNLTDSHAYQANGEFSVASMISRVFSLKVAYLVKYNNLPAPGITEKTDKTFTTAIVAKF